MTLHETIDPPVASPVRAATFQDLMASIGYLLFQWSLLSASLDDEIAQLRRATGDVVGACGRARTINERLAEWRALLGRGRRRPDHIVAIERVAARIQEHHRLHNLVANGFVAATTEAGPAIRCAHAASRHGPADEVRMTSGELVEMIDAMELCRSEMALLRGLGQH